MAAGACLSLLSTKPQLALVVLPALVATRRYRALAYIGVSAGVLCALSWAIFGGLGWRSLSNPGTAALMVLESEQVGSGKMVSVFAGARLLGVGVDGAWAIEGAASILAMIAGGLGGAAATGWVRGDGDGECRGVSDDSVHTRLQLDDDFDFAGLDIPQGDAHRLQTMGDRGTLTKYPLAITTLIAQHLWSASISRLTCWSASAYQASTFTSTISVP